MQILHACTPQITEGIFWGHLVGRNGRNIGNAPGAQQWDTTLHLFRVQRGTPPPIGDGSEYRRRWWTPYNNHSQTADQLLTTVHGRLRSAARFPRRYWANQINNLGWRTSICPECLRYASTNSPETNIHRLAVLVDPWTRQTDQQRGSQPDPISGM